MKKRWKIFWIICAGLAVWGIVMISAGSLLGGFSALRSEADEQVLERWINRLGIEEKNMADSRSSVSSEEIPENQINGTTVKEFYGIKEIDISLRHMAVSISSWDGESVIVDISEIRSDIAEMIRESQDDDELVIDMEHHEDYHTNNTGVIYIKVPEKNGAEMLEAETSDGLIEIEGTEIKELSLKTQAGQISAEGISAEQLEAECGAGMIMIDGKIKKEAELQCSVGEINCTLYGKDSDYDYDISCGIGKIKIGQDQYENIQKQIRKSDKRLPKIKADCDLGTIEIQFESI